MSIAQLTSTLQKQLAGDTTISKAEMQEWRRLYPYFALPLMLYARQEKQNDRESMALSALYTGDIEDWVGQLGLQQNYANLYPVTQRDASPNTVDTIDLFLHTYSKDEVMDEVLPLENEESNILKTTIHSQENVPTSQEEVIPLITIPVYDYMSQLESMPDADNATRMQGEDLLDKFLEADAAGEQLFSKPEHNITPEPAKPQIGETNATNEENEVLLSESLAKIYIQQRRYAKALEIIRKLSLNNPEKNVYFADQIRFLEKLIINIKT